MPFGEEEQEKRSQPPLKFESRRSLLSVGVIPSLGSTVSLAVLLYLSDFASLSKSVENGRYSGVNISNGCEKPPKVQVTEFGVVI